MGFLVVQSAGVSLQMGGLMAGVFDLDWIGTGCLMGPLV